MAFIRILSPRRAPPVLRLEGSTEMIAKCFSGYVAKNLRTNSSTSEDLPAPPVPVIPKTGTLVKSQTFANTDLPVFTANPTMSNLIFSTPTSELTTGTYYLVVRVLTGSASDVLRWSKDTDNTNNSVLTTFWYAISNATHGQPSAYTGAGLPLPGTG